MKYLDWFLCFVTDVRLYFYHCISPQKYYIRLVKTSMAKQFAFLFTQSSIQNDRV